MVRKARARSAARAPKRQDSPTVRKLIAFDSETLAALTLLARDRAQDFQELADEAFRDLLKKHRRPTTLKEQMKQSVRRAAAND